MGAVSGGEPLGGRKSLSLVWTWLGGTEEPHLLLGGSSSSFYHLYKTIWHTVLWNRIRVTVKGGKKEKGLVGFIVFVSFWMLTLVSDKKSSESLGKIQHSQFFGGTFFLQFVVSGVFKLMNMSSQLTLTGKTAFLTPEKQHQKSTLGGSFLLSSGTLFGFLQGKYSGCYAFRSPVCYRFVLRKSCTSDTERFRWKGRCWALRGNKTFKLRNIKPKLWLYRCAVFCKGLFWIIVVKMLNSVVSRWLEYLHLYCWENHKYWTGLHSFSEHR